MLGDPIVADTMPVENIAAKIIQYTRTICESFDGHFLPPAALGAGHEKLSNKMGACVHQLMMSSENLADLKAIIRSIAGTCTDMGVEIGLSECKQLSFLEWLHPSFQDHDICEDVSTADWVHEEKDDAYVFSNSLTSCGILHILDGLTKDLVKDGLGNGAQFIKHLDAICEVLCVSRHPRAMGQGSKGGCGIGNRGGFLPSIFF